MPVHEPDKADQLQGFLLHSLHKGLDPWETPSKALALYLPAQLASALDLEKARRAQERVAAKKAQALKEEAKLEALSKPAGRASDADAGLPNPPRVPVPGQDYDPRLMQPVYCVQAAGELAALAALAGPDRETRKRDEALGKRLLKAGPLRSIALLGGALEALDALRRGQPHFAPALGLVRAQVVLAGHSKNGLRIPAHPAQRRARPGQDALCPGAGPGAGHRRAAHRF